MKRIFILAIALFAIGLTVVSAQDYSQMESELLQVQQELQAGRITVIQAQQRIAEIQQRYLGMSDATIGGGSARGSTGSDAASQAQNQRLGEQATQQGMQAIQGQQQRDRDTFLNQGRNSGWPSSSILSQCSLSNLRQPAGTTASYNYDSTERRLDVFIWGGTQAHMDELARTLSGGNNYRGQSHAYINRPVPSGSGFYGFSVSLELQRDGIVLSTAGIVNE